MSTNTNPAAPTVASVTAYRLGISPDIAPTNTTPAAPARNANGMPIEPFMGYARNFLGSGYNCPALKLYGYSTERALNGAIRKAIGARLSR